MSSRNALRALITFAKLPPERERVASVLTASELQEFSDFFPVIRETMKTVKYLKEFHNFSAIWELAASFPTFYTNKWQELAKKVDRERRR